MIKYAVPTYLQGIHAKTPILWMPGATWSTPAPTFMYIAEIMQCSFKTDNKSYMNVPCGGLNENAPPP